MIPPCLVGSKRLATLLVCFHLISLSRVAEGRYIESCKIAQEFCGINDDTGLYIRMGCNCVL